MNKFRFPLLFSRFVPRSFHHLPNSYRDSFLFFSLHSFPFTFHVLFNVCSAPRYRFLFFLLSLSFGVYLIVAFFHTDSISSSANTFCSFLFALSLTLNGGMNGETKGMRNQHKQKMSSFISFHFVFRGRFC